MNYKTAEIMQISTILIIIIISEQVLTAGKGEQKVILSYPFYNLVLQSSSTEQSGHNKMH